MSYKAISRVKKAVLYGWLPDGGYRLWGRPIGLNSNQKSLMVFKEEGFASVFNVQRVSAPVKVTIELCEHGQLGKEEIVWCSGRKPRKKP